jgi:hypothetical protein
METATEAANGQVRRLLTVLFAKRAKRHLAALAEIYGWSAEMLAEYEHRFIQTAKCVPVIN